MASTPDTPTQPVRGPWGAGDVRDALFALGLLVLVWAGMWVPGALVVVGRIQAAGGPVVIQSAVTPSPAFLLAALCILPLAVRRRFPRSVLVAVTAATVLYQSAPLPPSMLVLGGLVALYTAASLLDRRAFALVAIPCVGALLLPTALLWASPMLWADLARDLAIAGGAAAVGDATRSRRAYVAEVERRAAEAERTREEEANRRVDAERLRIARELHDVTAHSLSIVAVQSGVALHVLDTDPEAARTALSAIRETSRDSLQELRGMLGVLRSSGEALPAAPLAPTPGLARLDELVRPLRDAGLRVEIGEARIEEPLPAMVDASAYRIVQEALTNVLRHAGSASVRVVLEVADGVLRIEVVDDGRGSTAAAAAEGHGIAGMRERAAALGGTFDAGPVPSGGWRVSASLPLVVRSA